MWPDLVILLGARGLLSLSGITLIVIGTWLSERSWDEQPIFVPENYEQMENNGDLSGLLSEMRLSYMSIVGWLLLAISYIFERHYWFALDWHPLVPAACLVALAVGFCQTLLLRKAMMARQLTQRRELFGISLGFGLVVLGMLTCIINGDAPVWTAPLGALFIVLSGAVLWFARKMGDTWDREQRVNPTPHLFNFGGPLFVTGWFWFYIGMNAVAAAPDIFYLPLYFNTRTVVAYIGIILILVVLWTTNYVLDEVPDEEADNLVNAPAFGMAGHYFGEKWEVKVGFTLVFGIFAISAFLPYTLSVVPFLLFVAILAQGVVVGLLHEKALRSGDLQQIQQWTKYVAYVTVVVIVLIAFHGWVACLLSIIGVALVAYGHYVLWQDRKRGKHWIETKSRNPNPVVYSFGALLVPLGMLLFAWSTTIL